jgi:hypothetical protein
LVDLPPYCLVHHLVPFLQVQKIVFFFKDSIYGACEFTRPRKTSKTQKNELLEKKKNLFFELAKLKQGFEITF